MNKRFLDVLTIVIDEIRDNSIQDVDLQSVVDLLFQEGFTDDEISFALSWLINNTENIGRNTINRGGLFPRPIWRNLNDVEREAISPKAFSYLFHLRELDILNDDYMERIIDRAVNLRLLHLNVEDMKDLITAVVLDFEDSASKGYFQFTSTRFPH